ncbi:hypothetical protein PHMEG_0007273 [Phytophthora megakarya]|uniref:Uncharacterized protein n=1 Tax=Phytophthora megakarya TaxID=4795 RepID=A0A225WMV7_9STRA|nr:hypothetical protein PHMEG_0007273 [Phytophthora megakarya]
MTQSPVRGRESGSPERQGLRTPNTFPERSSLEQGELAISNVINNPLDEAQRLELERELHRPHRPEDLPRLSEKSARQEHRFVIDSAKAGDDAVKDLLSPYIIGPLAITDSQRVQREKHARASPDSTGYYQGERHIDQDQGKSVPEINTIAVVLRPGESLDEGDARF